MSNQTWWRIVAITCTATVCFTAIACCRLLKTEPPRFERHALRTTDEAGFGILFDNQTGKAQRLHAEPFIN